MSIEQNHIDKLFQDAFANFDAKPSSNVWKGIITDAFDQNFRDSFSEFNEEPSPLVWTAIAAEYDFDINVQESFDEFGVNPPPRMWKAISSQMAFDESLNDAFQDYEVNPAPEVWENITSEAVDSRFKSVFSKFETEPREENWEKIRRAVPVNLFLRNSLNQLSKIAAILVVGLFLAFLVNYSGLFSGTNSGSLEIANSNNTIPSDIKSPPVKLEVVQPVHKEINSVAGIEEDVDEIVGTSIIEEDVDEIVSVDIIDNWSTKTSNTNNNTIHANIASYPKDKFVSPITPTIVQQSTIHSSALAVVETSEVKTAIKPSISKVVPQIEKIKVLDKLPSKEDVQLASANNNQLIDVNQLVAYDVNSVKSKHNPANYLLTSLAGAGSDIDAEMVKVKNSLVSRTDSKRALKMLNYRGVYVMVSGQYSNTWVINDDVKSKLSGLVQADYMMDFGGSFGAGLGIQISPRFGLEAQWNYSKLNQRYRELIPEGFYINSETSLTYSSFPVLARVQVTRVKNNRPNPMTSSLVLGMQYRYLRSASIKSEVEFSDPKELFLSQELGVVLGWDYSMHLNPNTFLTIGARAGVGADIHNLSSLSSESNYNAEFGLRMAVNYKISR